MADFKKALALTLNFEGLYSNVKQDPGGETFKGISRKSWPEWIGWQYIDSVKSDKRFPECLETSMRLAKAVQDFYVVKFWLPISGNQITRQSIADCIFDFAVNVGLDPAVKMAQEVIKVQSDGIVGNVTLGVLNAFGEGVFLVRYLDKKIDHYLHLVSSKPVMFRFLKGWLKRAIKILIKHIPTD